MRSDATIRWGILGPGGIARAFSAGLHEAAGAELAAVGSRDLGRAERFAAEFGAARAHGSYAALAADPEVDAVYIATPHAFHEAHTILCLEAGKHVLCEKPLALNATQARRMIDAARANDRLLTEALWSRFLPTWREVRGLLDDGAIGEVRLVEADFGFRALYDPASRLFDPAQGGGTLLDLGIYLLNLAFVCCGPPDEAMTTVTLGDTGVDEEASLLLHHDHGPVSQLSCSFRVDTPCVARIMGTEGRITLDAPWWGASRYTVHRRGEEDRVVQHVLRGGGYTDEAEAFMALIRAGARDAEEMPLAESVAILEVMDAIREDWGLGYPGE